MLIPCRSDIEVILSSIRIKICGCYPTQSEPSTCLSGAFMESDFSSSSIQQKELLGLLKNGDYHVLLLVYLSEARGFDYHQFNHGLGLLKFRTSTSLKGDPLLGFPSTTRGFLKSGNGVLRASQIEIG